jgi:DNA-binding transcriptional ArsR family regulator
MTIGPVDSPPFLKLIAHDMRWKILSLLANSDLRVQEISQALAQPQNLVSYHLQKLHQAELILEHHSIADARAIYYSLDFDRMDGHLQAIGKMLNPAFSSGIKIDLSHLSEVRVLFICTHNSARSQIAESILQEQSHHTLKVSSAGTEPTRVHPLAIQVMAERGIDIRQKISKGLDIFQNQGFDYVCLIN